MSTYYYGEIRLTGFNQTQLEEIFQAAQLKAFSQGNVAGVELVLERGSDHGDFKRIKNRSKHYDLLEVNKLVCKDEM